MAFVESGAIVEQHAVGRIVDAKSVRAIGASEIVNQHVAIAFYCVTSDSTVERKVVDKHKVATCNPETVNVVQVSSVRIKRGDIGIEKTIAVTSIPIGIVVFQSDLIAHDPHAIVAALADFGVPHCESVAVSVDHDSDTVLSLIHI